MTALFHLQADADLSARNTFRVAARAPWLLRVNELASLPEALELEQIRGLPLLMLGGGSNLLFAGDAPGAVVELRAGGVGIVEDRGPVVRVRAQAGADWHGLVMWSLDQGLCGLENLALIPGSVGAAPIQNIGAYGVEVGESILAVEAWDRQEARWVRLGRQACAFGYRDSLFKRNPERWIVAAVELELSRQGRAHPAGPRLGYAGIGEELAAMGLDPGTHAPTARDVAEAVIRLRRRKLPDPGAAGNAGSFFKNPVVPAAQAQALLAAHPRMPAFPGQGADTHKLSAAWLIDACGLKGEREGDAGVSEAHALVLVNHGRASGAQLLELARRIAGAVQARFGVALEPEPRIVGACW
ncbi:UDP-N-acetylenolpyruvoylglucosamine reductase [Pseudoxanthomonas broegbernensis]|uniref:UDP-N-acetylenolpyruvoylglucosamine reductase n=1 Tax=Pseudoxanthomonas broegbernensis TaxID=83619 RepID=A0A7V8GPG9_9GAMM|nr:UDP-N-acetylmuramate dehydrogenase [Pseudoxanthomonas broegbernensis]KAF1687715.1 UDP-N-acetylenolpyruvoylglucosamine reductase [Pseudoxanthomonas broegbernensis]MBB6064747.1 UDP-N-acetylmuramate dehydrogenase [Pseudoxanthomonas broegbernensis]